MYRTAATAAIAAVGLLAAAPLATAATSQAPTPPAPTAPRAGNSLLGDVIPTEPCSAGLPILSDILNFGDQSCVVNENGPAAPAPAP